MVQHESECRREIELAPDVPAKRGMKQLRPQSSRVRAVLIAGPTASGKSALAIRLAREWNGVIINADALQVYSCWRVLTARPSREDEDLVPHLLYGHVAWNSHYSVGSWLEDIQQALQRAGDRLPVLVGGTGLYFNALTSGLAPIPPIPSTVRKRAEELERNSGPGALLDTLRTQDPDTFFLIDHRNPARIRRAWEVLIATGRGLASWHEEKVEAVIQPDNAARLLVEADREWLAERIQRRAEWMMANGALRECSAMQANWNPGLPSSQALGAAEIMSHLQNGISMDETISQISAVTRRYAKRQRTWFRSKMACWQKVQAEEIATQSQLPQTVLATIYGQAAATG